MTKNVNKARGLFLLGLPFLLLLGSALSAQQEPSPKPMLRLEVGGHRSDVRAVSVDRAGHYAVTASSDKTLRVWDLLKGRLDRVVRPPIGAGFEGNLNACALSPDGELVAVGGWTGMEWEKLSGVYCFDRATGMMVRRLPGFTGVINHLQFSRDGRRLAICSQGGLSVRQWPSGLELFGDRDFKGGCQSSAFDATGRLGVASPDGSIRIYALDGKPVARTRLREGEVPWGLAFSPDGRQLACGSLHGGVTVLSGRDLTVALRPDCRELLEAFTDVAWSLDGRTLYADGHMADDDYVQFIRSWPEGGRGPAHALRTPFHSTLRQLIPLADARLLLVASDGLAMHSNAAGGWVLFANPVADFRGNPLATNAAANEVELSLQFPPKDKLYFNLPKRALGSHPQEALSAPAHADAVTEVLEFENSRRPTINGKGVTPFANGTCRSAALTKGEHNILMGTDFSLEFYNPSGAVLWRRAAPGVAWATNVSEDGRLGIAAFGDGTVRWYRLSDGKDLLAFFVHPRTRQWVLWTPSGYFDCSPGAESLLGWHLNRGKDQEADFFPVSRFRSTYYRPDVIDAILQTEDEEKALQSADAQAGLQRKKLDLEQLLPPVVVVLSPKPDALQRALQVEVQVRVHHPKGAPIDEVWAMVDGRPADNTRGLKLAAAKAEANADGSRTTTLVVPIPARACVISVLARSGQAISEAVSVPVRWAGPEQTEARGSLRMLAIGVSKYLDADLSLGFAAKDAQDLARRLGAENKLYAEVQGRVLLDAEASKEAILDGLEWLGKVTTKRDTAVLFLAGHGANGPSGQFFFLPYGADLARAKATMVADTDIQSALAAIPGRVVAFLDCCHSGDVLHRSGNATRFVNELTSAENGVVVFTASTGRQLSLESAEWGHGAFTKALTEGLDGRADLFKKGRITISGLDAYLSDRIPTLTKGQQTPTLIKPSSIPDFPVAMTP